MPIPPSSARTVRAAVFLVVVSSCAVVALTSACGEDPSAGSGGPPASIVLKNPLLGAEPGEWARYSMLGGSERTYRVVSAARPQIDQHVIVEEEERDPKTNATSGASQHRYDLNHFLRGFEPAGYVVVEIAIEEIRVAGRSWPCIRTDAVSSRLGVLRTWYSPDAPVLGIVRQVRIVPGGKETVNAEITAWGAK